MKPTSIAVSVLALVLTNSKGFAADPAPSASASKAAPPPLFSADLPPSEESPVPSAAEWKTAPRFVLDRALWRECDATRVREWVRITCTGTGASVGLIAGPNQGFSAMVGVPHSSADDSKVSYYAQFPMRRGERRLVELRMAGRGNYDETLYATGAIYVSTQWNDGEPPILVSSVSF